MLQKEEMTNLLARARTGDKSAENEVFRHFIVRFRYLAKKKIWREDDAEDIAQEVCRTVLEKYKKGEIESELEIWAIGVLRNKIGNYIQTSQSNRAKKSTWFDEITAGDQSHGGDMVHLKEKLLKCLRMIIRRYPRYARVLNLVSQGYSAADVSRRLGIKVSNCYVILNRGRNVLAKCLKTGQV